MASAYRQLEERFQRIALLGESIGMLSWDQSVMMPEGGAAARGEQIAALVRRYTEPEARQVILDAKEDLSRRRRGVLIHVLRQPDEGEQLACERHS